MVGAIGKERLDVFKTIRAFRLTRPLVANKITVRCKVCGERVGKAGGVGVLLPGERTDHFDPAYLCGSCWKPVAAAYEQATQWGWLKFHPDLSTK